MTNEFARRRGVIEVHAHGSQARKYKLKQRAYTDVSVEAPPWRCSFGLGECREGGILEMKGGFSCARRHARRAGRCEMSDLKPDTRQDLS